MITIYGSDGTAKVQAPCDDNSTQVEELQGDNVLALSFTLYRHVPLEVNDYADFLGKRYWLMEQYRPEQVSTVEWKYELKLYGIESLVRRFLVLNDTDGADEAVFTLTAPPREHVALIVRSINEGMGTTDWKVGEVAGTDNIVIDYNGKYCDEALKEVAEKAGNRAEWWMDGLTVNVCYCSRGEEITLGYGKGLTSLSCDTADNVEFYTRLYPLGSSRNIDPEHYGHTRLQLPGGVKHVDVNVDKYGVWHRFEEDAFAGIYPRYTGTVGSVRSEEVTGEDGNPYKIYYFKDDALPFDPNDYEIGGKVKRISFQEGSALAGLGSEEDGTYYFEANFDSDTLEWELITIWPYDDDTQLPNDTLAPKPGDRYIPWNFRMPDEYYPLAEQEFLEAVQDYNEQNALDVSRYKSPTDHVYVEKNSIDLYLGRRVKLESEKYFPETGFRSSRITKITRRVNLPSQMDVEISDAVSVGARESINDSIEGVRNYVREVSGSFPDIVRSWENTPASDYNVASYKMVMKQLVERALSRMNPDQAHGLITFQEGAVFGKDGFAAGLAGFGAKIDGRGYGEMRGLTLWEWLQVPELRYNRVEIYLGIRWNTPGSGIILTCTPDTDAEGNMLSTGTCTLKLEDGEPGAVSLDDICMGIYHFGTEADAAEDSDDSRGNFTFAGFATAYFRITGVSGSDNGTFTYSLRPGYTVHPQPQMHFSCYGNFTNKSRQNSMYQTRDYTRVIVDQNTWEIGPQNIRFQYGKLDNLNIHGLTASGYGMWGENVYLSGQFTQVKPDGTPVRTANDRGAWPPEDNHADYYDRFSYQGSLWLCVNEDGTDTAPADGNPDWLKQVDRGQDGSAAHALGDWYAGLFVPYLGIVRMGGSSWQCTVAGGTDNPPLGVIRDKDGACLLQTQDGGKTYGYILTGLTNTAEYQLVASDGTDGKDGTNGTDGKDGNGIASVTVEYATSATQDTAPTSWQATQPAMSATAKYLWQRETTTYTDGALRTIIHVVAVYGDKGDPGEDGKSAVNLGDWFAGLFVPYLGIVRMGGSSWQCTVAGGTDNPPLGVIRDKDGACLLQTQDGGKTYGYLLTGLRNTDEYVLVAADGEQGLDGCIIRRGEWAMGIEWRNDQGLAVETRYLDVALVRDSSTATGWRAYKCKVTHTSTTANAPGNATYWEEFGVNTTAIFTSLIIAKDARIDFMSGNQLLIQKDDGTVTAGLSGSQAGDKVRIWAGASTPDTAPFRVTEDGKVIATDAEVHGTVYAEYGEFTGTVNATAGQIAGVKIQGNALTNESFQNDAYIILRNDSKGTFAGIGGNMMPATTLTEAVGRFENDHVDTQATAHVGLYLKAGGVNGSDDVMPSGNIALYISGGKVAGLRPYLRRVGTSQTLSKLDYYVVCVNTDAITITLPSGCEDGQTYMMYSTNGGRVNIKASAGDTLVGTTSFTTVRGHLFVYDAFNKNWYISHLESE